MTTLDLGRLGVLHPRLPDTEAQMMASRAGHALDRSMHTPPTVTSIDEDGATSTVSLSWRRVASVERQMIEEKYVTEDGAHAIALLYVSEHRGWRAIRRIAEKLYGDWLVCEDGTGQNVALEVGGTTGRATTYVERKIEQVRKCIEAKRRAAVVVGFVEPQIVHRSVP